LQEATTSLLKIIGRSRVEELNRMLEERKYEPVLSFLLEKHYDPLYKYPEGPSEDFNFSVNTKNTEKAAGMIFNFIANLPKYK
jgi:tRNA 2-selenouridine synthase